MTSRVDLGAHLLLGVTMQAFGATPALGDARLLAHGRVHLVPDWWNRSQLLHQNYASFLHYRSEELAEDDSLFRRLLQALENEDDFRRSGGGESDQSGWRTTFELVPGAGLDARIESWLQKLEDGRNRTPPEFVLADNEQVASVTGGGASFTIPARHLPPDPPSPLAVTTSAPLASIEIDHIALQTLAKRLDAAAPDGDGKYEDVVINGFLDRLRTSGRSVGFDAGVVKLLVAPTGSGKSFFARLLAVDLASRGIPTALVVPDVATAWNQVRAIRSVAKPAGLDLAVEPLQSWRGLPDHLASYFERPPPQDADIRWALEAVGYACHLAAYIDDGTHLDFGDEPCNRLRQHRQSSRPVKVSCPYDRQCGRFAPFERSTSADIIVINHHAFLQGRVPIPVSVDGAPASAIDTAELVLRRCPVVLVDEIDALQGVAIDSGARNVALSSRGQLSKFHRLHSEVERSRAEDRFDGRTSFERARSSLVTIMNEAERLAELLNREALAWPAGTRLTWREANDAEIGQKLFGDTADHAMVRALYDSEPIADERTEALRQAVSPLLRGPAETTVMLDVRAKIMAALEQLPVKTGRLPIQETRSRLADALIIRAVLLRIDQGITHLRPQLPALERSDIRLASEIRGDLLGFASFQPSPAGPLGQQLYGYSFQRASNEAGVLQSQVMSGDPHGLITELGRLAAQMLAGTERIVMGLSATCRFRGSPHCDVLGELTGSLRDDARNVVVREAPVEARISGSGAGSTRLEATAAAAEELWTTSLEHYLTRLHADPAMSGRARALVVTGSYAEAEVAARALSKQTSDETSVVQVVSPLHDDAEDHATLSRSELARFGETPEPSVLVGPLAVLARGHNILQPGTTLSAIAGVFVLTRPVPPSHDAGRYLAHLSYSARLFPPRWSGQPHAVLRAERRESRERLWSLQRSSPTFRYMDQELRRELICDVLADLAQLAGRARRGGTSVDLFFVDQAFQDETSSWADLVRDVLEWWQRKGWLHEMVDLHGAYVTALMDYASFDPPTPA